jgi:hypothetical protein
MLAGLLRNINLFKLPCLLYYFPAQGFEIFATADLLVGAHGAAFTNALVMRPGAALLDFIPEGHAGKISRATLTSVFLSARSVLHLLKSSGEPECVLCACSLVAGTGLMYAYLPRFIAAPACPALLGVPIGGKSGDAPATLAAIRLVEAAGGGRVKSDQREQPAAPTVGLLGHFSGCLPVSLEYHQILVPGTKVSATISADLRSARAWLTCAVARSRRTPGAPSCAALTRAWGMSPAASSERSIQRYVSAASVDETSGAMVPAVPSFSAIVSGMQASTISQAVASPMASKHTLLQKAASGPSKPVVATVKPAQGLGWSAGAAGARQLLAVPTTPATAANTASASASKDAMFVPNGAPVPPHLWGLVHPLLQHRPPLPPPLDRTPSVSPAEPLYALRPLAAVTGLANRLAGLDLRDVWVADEGVVGGVSVAAARGIALLLPGAQVRSD